MDRKYPFYKCSIVQFKAFFNKLKFIRECKIEMQKTFHPI